MTTEITQLIVELKEKVAVLLVAEAKATRLIAGRKAVITKIYGKYKTLKPTNTYAMALAEAETLLNNLTNERKALSELLFQLQYQLDIASRQDWTFVTPAPVAETVEVAAPVAQDGFSLTTEALLDILSDTNNWSVATRVVDGPYIGDDGIEGRMIQRMAVHVITGLEIVTYANLLSDGQHAWTEAEDYDPIELNAINADNADGWWSVEWLVNDAVPMRLQAIGADTAMLLN